MTQQLRNLTALAEDLNSAPGTDTEQFLPAKNHRRSITVFSHPQPTHTQTFTYTYIYIQILKISKMLFNSLWVTYISFHNFRIFTGFLVLF